MRVSTTDVRHAIVTFIKHYPMLTAKDVAEHFGCSPTTVYRYAKQAGVKLPRPSRIDYKGMSGDAMAALEGLLPDATN